MGTKMSVPGLIMSIFPYLRSAMVRFPLPITHIINHHLHILPITNYQLHILPITNYQLHIFAKLQSCELARGASAINGAILSSSCKGFIAHF